MEQYKILVTGSAGFIGFHLCSWLLKNGFAVTGIDNLNSYYDVRLKQNRLLQLGIKPKDNIPSIGNIFKFILQDILDKKALNTLFEKENFTHVIHLAAQAGVRYSVQNPQAYMDSNIQGFLNLLEACRLCPPSHLIFASSSSVYGLNNELPFSTNFNTDHPISFYAVSKKANELMAHVYAHLYGIPCTGLRFFSVYGPWGRPDMAYFDFTRKIINGEPIEIYNNGNLKRDFTYIDDIINGIVGLLEKPPSKNSIINNDSESNDFSSFTVPFRIFNIGNHSPINLLDFIYTLERIIGMKARRIFKAIQPGDVETTYADIHELTELTGFNPTTTLEEGLNNFVEWYREYYKV